MSSSSSCPWNGRFACWCSAVSRLPFEEMMSKAAVDRRVASAGFSMFCHLVEKSFRH